MVTIKSILEEREDEKHAKEERDYFKIGVQCLNGLIEFVQKEEKEDETSAEHKKHYKEIADLSEELRDLMKEHMKSYED